MLKNSVKVTKETLEALPQNTGVYKFHDRKGNILYIGKALNLKARVTSYFRSTHYDRPYIIQMIPKIHRIETIITDNEVESFILESALIKKHKPKFNIELKDDKSFSWIHISTNEEFPRVRVVRSIKKGEFNKGKLFGPFPKGKTVKSIFDYIRKIYPFCTCVNPKDLCLYYHLGLCPGPHHGKISQEDYMKNIDEIVKFLKGNRKNIIKKLEKEMKSYAKKQEFEKARVLRDKVSDLQYISQKVAITPFTTEEEYVNSGHERVVNSMESLSKKLGLKKLDRIECYDVSNINGKFAYGSMSVGIKMKLEKNDYRIFKINESEGPNDIFMLEDVLKRRLRHIGKDMEDLSLFQKPDLILIDGGRAHLSVLSRIVPIGIKLIAISKGKHLKKKRKNVSDEFWFLENNKVKKLSIEHPFFLVNLRDEAHRFGLKHYRKNISKYSQTSVLDKIEGVGVKRRKKLLKHYKSIDEIKKSDFEELNRVLKNKKVAAEIYDHFRS